MGTRHLYWILTCPSFAVWGEDGWIYIGKYMYREVTEWILEEGWNRKGKREEYLDGRNGRVITHYRSREWMDNSKERIGIEMWKGKG